MTIFLQQVSARLPSPLPLRSPLAKPLFRAASALRLGLLLLPTGCASLDSAPKLDEAMDLAGQRTGIRPDWDIPWDETPPAWQPGELLALDDAIALALRNNRELRGELQTIGRAQAELVQAGLLSNPVVNFMMMFPSGGGRAMLRANALPMQPLQDLWLIPARSEVATAALQTAVLRLADRGVETVAEVKKTYAEVQFAQRSVELMRAGMELVRQSTSIIEISQAAGKASQVEVSVSRIRHERLRSDLLAMDAELAARKHELLRLMGLADAADDWTVAPFDEAADAVDEPEREERLVLLAGEQRLDLKAAEWEAESAMRRITLTRREGWPDLALGFTFERSPAPRSTGPSARARAFDAAAAGLEQGLSGEPSMPGLPRFSPRASPPREVKYTLGPMIELELPIFDWGQAQTAMAMHEYQQRLADYDARLQTIVRDVRQTLVRQAEAREQLQLFREVILPEVQRNLELARQAYVAGQTNLIIYLQTQEDLIETRQKMLDFLRRYRLSRAELERAVGGELALTAPTTQPASLSPSTDDARDLPESEGDSNEVTHAR